MIFRVEDGGSNWNPANWLPNLKQFLSEMYEKFIKWIIDCIHDFIIWLVDCAFDVCDFFIGLVTDLFGNTFDSIGNSPVTAKVLEVFGIVDLFFPVGTFFQCVTLFGSFCLSIWVIRRIFKFIPFIGG